MKKKLNPTSPDFHPITIIRYLMVLAFLVCAVYLQVNTDISSADPETVFKNVEAVSDFSAMKPADNRMIKRLYQLNANDYDKVILYAPASNMDAQELLIIKLKDISQADSVKSAIEARLKTQMDSFDGYGVEQYKMLQDHVLLVKGNYIFYFVNPQTSKGEEAFLNSL